MVVAEASGVLAAEACARQKIATTTAKSKAWRISVTNIGLHNLERNTGTITGLRIGAGIVTSTDMTTWAKLNHDHAVKKSKMQPHSRIGKERVRLLALSECGPPAAFGGHRSDGLALYSGFIAPRQRLRDPPTA